MSLNTCHKCGAEGHSECMKYPAPCPTCRQDAEWHSMATFRYAVGSGYYFTTIIADIVCPTATCVSPVAMLDS